MLLVVACGENRQKINETTKFIHFKKIYQLKREILNLGTNEA